MLKQVVPLFLTQQQECMDKVPSKALKINLKQQLLKSGCCVANEYMKHNEYTHYMQHNECNTRQSGSCIVDIS